MLVYYILQSPVVRNLEKPFAIRALKLEYVTSGLLLIIFVYLKEC